MSFFLWSLGTWAGVATVLLVGFLAFCRAALHDDRVQDARRAACPAARGLAVVPAPEPAPLSRVGAQRRHASRPAEAVPVRVPS